MSKKYKIVAICQCYNEVRKRNLERFLSHVEPLVSALVVYDDASTDGSYELVLRHTKHVIRGLRNDFENEISHKQALLTYALTLDPDFILWLDVDEVLTSNAATRLQELCEFCVSHGFDGISLHELNLWRSTAWRRTDNLYDTGWFTRLWRVTPGISFGAAESGLHQSGVPQTVQSVSKVEDVAVLHYGFATERSIAFKYLSDRSYGQRGRMLSRLIDEEGLTLEKIPPGLFPSDLSSEDDPPARLSFEEAFSRAAQFREEAFVPAVSIICLIYKSTEWLRFVYEQVMRYTDLRNMEFYFVANDATEDVLDYLRNQYIPHVVWNNSEQQRQEFYINNVYRAWNCGAHVARGDYLLFINSDMALSPGWFEGLFEKVDGQSCVASRLVESGKLHSGLHGVSRDFGRTVSSYDEEGFLAFAQSISEHSVAESGLFMPLLLRRDDFWRVGGYPEGNIVPGSSLFAPRIAAPGEPCVSGDQVLMQKLSSIGVHHRTAFDSVVYHFQCGEMDSAADTCLGGPRVPIVLSNDLLTGHMGERTMWDFLLESLPNVVGIDQRVVGSEGNFSSLARHMLQLKYPSSQIVVQNATFMDLICPDRFSIVYLQDDLRRMGRPARQQEENLRRAQLIVTNSTYTASSYAEYDIQVVPIGVDEQLFKPMDKQFMREKHGFGAYHRIGISVGAFDDVKGWPAVRTVVERRTDIFWILVSKDQQTYSHDNARVFHRIPQTLLSELLNCADFFVLGSPVETECLAAIEACFCNVPVVMRQTGVFADFTDSELDRVGVFGLDLGRGVEQVLAGTYSPREAMLQRGLTVEAMVDSWIKLLQEARSTVMSGRCYIGGDTVPRILGQKPHRHLDIRLIHAMLLRELGYALPVPAHRFVIAADSAMYSAAVAVAHSATAACRWTGTQRVVQRLRSKAIGVRRRRTDSRRS